MLELLSPYVPLFQTLVWVAVIVVGVLVFFPHLKELLETIHDRVASGSSLKAWQFELGEDLENLRSVDEQSSGVELGEEVEALERRLVPAGMNSGVAPAEEETESQWNVEREEVYTQTRGVFLTHVISPTTEPGQKYKIFIYLIRHKDRGFADVDHAEFFLGPYWGNQVFQRREEKGRIGLTTAAYGTFLCTCWVHFKDGGRVYLTRYIDFEMARAFKDTHH